MTSPWPFVVWEINLIGQLPKGRGSVQYALVVVDYITKWIKAEALGYITLAKIKEFVYKNIVCQYGVPHIVVSDNSKQFDNDEFKEFCDNLHIKNVFSFITQPQANGQVKALNKTIKHNLKTKLEDLKKKWANELPKVLWAYRTTATSITRETRFSLAYKYEAMAPVEIRAGSLRRDNYDPE